ncbi:3-isopropylmalate dehydratase small subunit [Allomesorhizobium camelthorni]|uniref:3-isopropylmalate dehydratase small subunit n=1 Tax=Allomesorhizobium camelthorni TaxID=475069 RepID=A0A6G4WHQ0_9HYPH|nr:3-isopropylmalate dehydratase small subunit [Mesorhizobium camelthorni]NGO53746.1 3-isopropylmalate dehydratase small subunit [Mesorhizobium camelthorni]
MEKFTKLDGVAASFPIPNINTDAVIPASYQRTLKDDPGKGLFAGWRYDLDGKEVPDFILNREPFRQSRIIVAGENFGCGSSREFAVWALMRFGIRCVIAPSFGDIFYENAFKNGLLPIILSPSQVDRLHDHLAKTNNPSLTVDLEKQIIELPNGESVPFTVPPSRRTALLEGLDEIGQTLRFGDEITDFQRNQKVTAPWVYARPQYSRSAKENADARASIA